MEIRSLSASRVNTFLICPYRYYCQYCEELTKLPTAPLAIGGIFHESTKHNYRQKCDTRQDLPISDVLDIFSAEFDATEIEFHADEERGKEKDSGIGILREYQAVVAPGVQPVEAEARFVMKFKNKPWVFTGRTDVVDETGIVMEIKTTSRSLKAPKPNHLLQTYGYTQAIRRKLQSKGIEARIDYAIRARDPKVISFPVNVTDSEERYFLTLISQVAKAIEAEAWPPNRVSNNLCSRKYCQYWHECEEENGGRIKE